MCGLDGTFYRLKAANFNANLHKIFRYAIRADLAANCHIGGQGEIGGNDFVDHNKDPGSTMHELGHTLGLRHGGLDDHNCKPNYLSVMNYTHQTRIDQTSGGWIIDFSPPRHAGGRGQALPTLRENALDETRALDPGDPSNTFVFTDLRGRVVRHAVNLPVDWDGNGVIDNSQLQPVNIDNRPELTCDNTSNDSILVGYDDWRHISVPFWQFRDSDNSAVNPVTVHEPTDAELHAIEQAVNTTDLALTVTSSRPAVSIGDALEYSLNVANLGPNQAQQVQVVDTLPAGLLYRGASPSCSLAADNKLTCDLGMLDAGASRQVSIATLVTTQAQGPTLTSAAIVANGAWPDAQPANNSASVEVAFTNGRIVDHLLALYAFQEGSGTTALDLSGAREALDLPIRDPIATHWTTGGLAIDTPTMLASSGPATKITSAISDSRELTIETWLRPTDPTQLDATIATLATDAGDSSARLAQIAQNNGDMARYEARLRTSATSATGRALRTPSRSVTADLTHVIFTRDALGVARIYVNGILRAKRTIAGDLSPWDTSARLLLASDPAGRSWQGEYQLVALYNRALSPAEVTQNFHAGPSGDVLSATPLGIQTLYTFAEQTGDTVHDLAPTAAPLDLRLTDPAAVTWTADGLAITAPTLIVSDVPATRITQAMTGSAEVSLEVWVTSAGVQTPTLARIASISGDSVYRDVELLQEREEGQDDSRYTGRLRTTETLLSGKPPLRTPTQLVATHRQHIVFTRDALGLERLYVDGTEVARDMIGGDFSNWNHTYRLSLGNTVIGDRPWLGTYHRVALYNRALSPAEVQQHQRDGLAPARQ